MQAFAIGLTVLLLAGTVEAGEQSVPTTDLVDLPPLPLFQQPLHRHRNRARARLPALNRVAGYIQLFRQP